MNKYLNINISVMLLVSVVFTFITAGFIAVGPGQDEIGVSFLLGRSFAGVVIPLILVSIPLAIIRRGKRKFTKGPHIILWSIFFVFSLMALFGSALPPESPGL